MVNFKKLFLLLLVLIPIMALTYDGSGDVNLPNRRVLCFQEDKYGVMWIGTARGLSRYDGYSYENFFHLYLDSTTIASDCIQGLFLDHDSMLWVATTEGVSHYDYGRHLFENYNLGTGDETSGFIGFFEYGDKLYAYGTGGVFIVNRINHKLVPVNGLKNVMITCYVADHKGGIWLGGSGSSYIYYMNLRNNKVVRKSMGMPVNARCMTIINGGINSQRLLVGTEKGLVCFDTETAQKINDASVPQYNRPVTFLRQLERTLLIGTYDSGVKEYDLVENRFAGQYASSFFQTNAFPHVTCCYVDRNKNFWLGTFDDGYKIDFNRKINTDQILNKLISGKFVTRVSVDHYQNLWFGTRYNGLCYYNTKTKKYRWYNLDNFQPFSRSNSNFIQSQFIDSTGNIWIACGTVLISAKVDEDGNLTPSSWSNTYSDIVSITEDYNHNIWFGSAQKGIGVINIGESNGGKRPFVQPSVARGNVTFVLPLKSGNIIYSKFGSGLFVLDPSTGKTSQLIKDKKLRECTDRTIFIYGDKESNIWLGTYGRGLIRYSMRNHSSDIYTMGDGLPCNDIVSITGDGSGCVWLSTAFGITRFNPQDKSFYTLYDQDGTGGNQFHEKSLCKLADGTLLFGGNHGLTYFNPVNIASKIHQGNIVLEDLKVMNVSQRIGVPGCVLKRNIEETDKVSLSYKQNSFSLDYTCLDYASQRKINYAYKLEGFDKDWNYVGQQHRIAYSNLAAGNYTLCIKASLGKGAWDGQVRKLEIHVGVAPWLSWQAVLLYIVVIAFAILFATRTYMRIRISRMQLEVAERKRKQDRELMNTKITFFTNISHELRTPLSMIYGPLSLISMSKDTSPENKRLINIIKRNTERLLVLVEQLLDIGKIETQTLTLSVATCDVNAIVKDIISNCSFLIEKKQLHVNCQFLPKEQSHMLVDGDKIFKIVSNLFTNAIKYTDEKGHIEIILSEVENLKVENFVPSLIGKHCLVITVADDGVGMPPDKMSELFSRYSRFEGKDKITNVGGHGIGLNYVKSIVTIHHGDIFATNGEEKGLTFKVALPVDADEYNEDERGRLGHQKIFSMTDVADGETSQPQICQGKEEKTAAIKVSDIDENEGRRKILVVEDNVELGHFIYQLLSKDYQVALAVNGQKGLDMAKEMVPDLIITDVMMPVMNGYELCKEVKNDMNLSHVPVVILTAKNMIQDQLEGYEQGADMYINKPFLPAMLLKVIENVFRQQDLLRRYVMGEMLNCSQDKPSDGEDNNAEELEETNKKNLALSKPQKTQDEHTERQLLPMDKVFLEKLKKYLNDNISDPDLNVNTLGNEMCMSRTNFYRKVKALTGLTPNDLLQNYRLNRAVEYIKSHNYTMNEISEMVGFKTQSHFSTSFKKFFGMSPSEYLSGL